MNPHVEVIADLAAQLPPEDREDYLASQCPDAAVRACVAGLLQAAEEAEAYFDAAIRGMASSLSDGREPAQGDVIGAYRVLSVIGQGGMGSVYLAERTGGELQQRVAIKVLRLDTHWLGWGDRFLRERQLLASLQHASIVHVIDAGQTSDGRPFLVMEHVEGIPIDRYAAGVDIRQRLNLFLRVCDGVSHAHRHLIVHRDLKPSNILVDAAGQPKLLDFGIAKLLDSTDDTAQTAGQWMTPNYASPEQLKGNAQSTATDVYSLGAVLYELLTGIAPGVRIGPTPVEPARPSSVDAAIPRDLDFVVALAMRPEPEQRYASVDEFANDLRAVLQRRPVKARGRDVWYRARKSLSRHWMPLAAVLLVTSSLSAGLFLANRQRALAERRFMEVRQLSHKLFDIDTQVAQLPGGARTRQLIVDTALEYLKRVSVDARMEPGLALELGTAYLRVARVLGVSISANLGQTEQADQAARQAEAFIASALSVQPRNRTALLRAGQIAHDRMILAGDRHQEDDAVRFAGQAVERLNQYLDQGALTTSSDRAEAQQVILALINIANRYLLAAQFERAQRIAGRAIDIAHATNWPTQAGAALMIVAMAHRSSGELDQALQAIHESVRLLEPPPDEKALGRHQAYGLALIREAQILGEDQAISLNRPEEAIERLEQALKSSEAFASRDASDFLGQNRIYSVKTKLAAILWHTQPARALELYDDALARLSLLKSNGGTVRNEITALSASTYPLRQLGKRAEARRRLDAAFERLRLQKEYPAARIELGSPADDTLRAFAEYEAGDNFARGAQVYEELIRLIANSNPQHETLLKSAVDMSNLLAGAARVYRRAGVNAPAAELEGRRLQLWQRWNAKLPNNAFLQRQLDAARVTK